MAEASRSCTTSTTRTTTGLHYKDTTTPSRLYTARSRPRTVATSTSYDDNEIICAISESRGISPTIGLSFINLSTSEAVLCQFADTQMYARTCHKIKVFSPSEIIFMSTAQGSKLLSIIQENVEVERNDILMTSIDRRYWAETTGHEYLQQLAFPDDIESLKISIGGNYFAACCFAAVLKYIELGLGKTFAAQSLRIKFETSEGSMMIDLSTIASLELIQNLQNQKSKHSLYGLLNETLTAMGARFLRSNILQPSTDAAKIQDRYEALEEITTKEELFFATRNALKSFVDTDRILASLVIFATKIDFQHAEQSINHVLMLKTFVDGIKPIWQALAGVNSNELTKIRELCFAENYQDVRELIKRTLNDDVVFSTQPIELRHQRIYAIKAGVNGFLDVARQTYKEANQDAYDLVEGLNGEHEIALDLKFEPARQYYIRIPVAEFEDKEGIPNVFVNVVRRKKMVECQTLELVKLNQKITDAHNEVVNMSDRTIQEFIEEVRTMIYPLFKISEGIAMLDMIAAFAQLVTVHEYSKPEITATLAIQAGRHPVREKIQYDKYVANDVYADPSSRFQVITGCNMSGKSTYIRSIALMTVMAQVGCFVPAQYASFPMTHSLFARVSTDDNIEANVSTFASEMREMAFILRNSEKRSLIIIDELGRGTSTTDGLAIAIAIAESLIETGAFVWFVTHFRDLPRILVERAGVVNLHLAVHIFADASKMKMLYKIANGYEEEKFYGLGLARVVNLPEQVMDMAAEVSTALNERNKARKSNAKALAVARRRKLVLTLKQQLLHANNGNMNAEKLREWLQKLQEEFLVRMSAISEEANAVDEGQKDVTVETEDRRESPISADESGQVDDGLIRRRNDQARADTVETESPNQTLSGRKEQMAMPHTTYHGEHSGKLPSESPSQLIESVETPSVPMKHGRLIHQHPFVTRSIKLEPRQRRWAGGDLAEDPIDIDDDD